MTYTLWDDMALDSVSGSAAEISRYIEEVLMLDFESRENQSTLRGIASRLRQGTIWTEDVNFLSKHSVRIEYEH